MNFPAPSVGLVVMDILEQNRNNSDEFSQFSRYKCVNLKTKTIMSMSSKEISLRMKFRKMSTEDLQAVLANDPSELEAKLAKEFLEKNGTADAAPAAPENEPEKESPKKAAPKKAAPKAKKKVEPVDEPAPKNPEKEEEAPEQEAEPEVKEHPMLTDEEEKLLSEAEKEFAVRQANRKTPSKTDRGMKEQALREKAQSESKRENLEESTEVPGLKVGSEVMLKGDAAEGTGAEAIGVITRVYRSGDGKEKCMVKFGDEKPIKKRVTAVTIVQK